MMVGHVEEPGPGVPSNCSPHWWHNLHFVNAVLLIKFETFKIHCLAAKPAKKLKRLHSKCSAFLHSQVSILLFSFRHKATNMLLPVFPPK